MKPSDRAARLVALGLTLLAFGLRAHRLDAQSYWIDEAWTAYFANLPIQELWRLLQTTEPLPPFYHPATVYWVQLVGDGEYALRFLSVIFGVLAVPLTYRLGRDVGDRRLGLLAALLMTVAPYQVWHSQEARMYSALAAASVMSMWGFVNLWQRGGWRWWLVYVLGSEWAIMSHYHGAVLIGIQGLFVLLTWRRRWRSRRLVGWISAVAAIVVLLAPWLIFGGNLLRSYLNWIEQPRLWDTYIRSALAYSVGELVPRLQAIPLTLVFVALYGLGLVYAARRSWGAWRGAEMLILLLAYTLAPNLAAWLYGEIRTTVYLERYLIPVQTGYLLTVAMGVLALSEGLHRHLAWGAPALAGLALAAVVGIDAWALNQYYYDPAYARPNWRGVAHMIQTFELPGDAVVITGDGGEKAFNYYYRGHLPLYLDFNTPVPAEVQARQIMARIAATHRRIWYTPYGVPIDTTLESWLAQNAYPAWQSWLGRKRLALYAGSAAVTARHETLKAAFSDDQGRGLMVEGVDMPAGTIPAGDVVPLTLTWSALSDLSEDYKLSLRLSNAQGDIFVQSDWPPLAGGTSSWSPGQPISDRRALWLPPDLPPGDYRLQLVVYHPITGQPLGQPITVPGLAVGPAEQIVPPQALSIPNRTQQAMGALNLVGYALPQRIQPGQDLWLWLYWQATEAGLPDADSRVRLSLTSQGEAISADFGLEDSVGGLDAWQPGQVRRAIYHLPTSPRLSGEQAQLSLTLVSGAGVVQADAALAWVALETRPRQFKAPPIPHPAAISFGHPTLLKLIGYQTPATALAPGAALSVTLFWQAEAEIGTNYTVFVQLLNHDGKVVAQQDVPPMSGSAPTTTWLAGEILTDAHSLALPTDLLPGSYRLIAGMYDPATGQRLPILSGGDYVDLGMVMIQ